MVALTSAKKIPWIGIGLTIVGFITVLTVLNLSGIQERLGVETRSMLKMRVAEQTAGISLLMNENAALKAELALQARAQEETLKSVSILEAAASQDVVTINDINAIKEQKIREAIAIAEQGEPPDAAVDETGVGGGDDADPIETQTTPALYQHPDGMKQQTTSRSKAKTTHRGAKNKKAKSKQKQKAKTGRAKKTTQSISMGRQRALEIAISKAQIEALWATYCEFNPQKTCQRSG